MDRIRVLVADDHAVVRAGLRALIATEPGMELVAEAEDGQAAVDKAVAVKPDVILLDLQMPKLDGLRALEAIRQHLPEARVLILTSFASDDHVFPAIRAGALGYLLKDTPPDQLVAAIRDVAHGESSLHPAIARRVLRELAAPPSSEASPETTLTEREVEVLQHVAKGLSNEEIAARLFLSERTVRTHVSNILGKLHLSNRTQAALYALRQGLTDLNID